MIRKVLAWAQRNERHLGALVFIWGFITDIITFVFLDISLVNIVFAAYLGLAASAIFLTHFLASHPPEKPSIRHKSALVLLPLVAQYLIGNLLSGFLIFYTKSSVFLASWPFLILIALIFIGNEWFRRYKDRITFMAVLLFFTAYSYAIFALPLFVLSLGAFVFLGSTAIALVSFGIFLALLYKAGRMKLRESILPIIGSCLLITVLVSSAYFSGLIPPIPLTLKEGGIYHSVGRVDGQYVLEGEEEQPWFDIRTRVVHVTPGESLSAFTAVFAPIRFGTVVVHRWQRYNEEKGAWVTQSKVAFPIAGGRTEGYRGYSETGNPLPGEWRVRVETENGQVIGQMRFRLERTETPPVLHEEVR
ncbi:MAG: DUF2914 domain-containing protein [Patescibacteria group bacterium]